ncbi:MAG: PaaI family thioesterase [Smithellaceae bacterium]
MIKEDHYRKLENMMHDAPIVKLTGARIHISEGRSELTLPVRQDLFHAAGALHGSMYFLALDNAAWFAVNSLVPDVFVLTVSFNVHLIRPVDKGMIRAEGFVTNSTRSQFFADAILYDEDNREIARGSGTFVRGKAKLTPEIGYK